MTASRPCRMALAVVIGVGCMVLAVGVGSVLTLRQVDQGWLAFALPLAMLRRGHIVALGADLTLNAVKAILLFASAALVVVRARESPARGLQVTLVLLLANFSVQVLKHWPDGPPPILMGVEPLSGHAALVGAVTLSWLVTRRGHDTFRAACVVSAAVIATCLVAVVPGRHSPIQVACPLVICLGWVLALPLVQPGRPRTGERSPYAYGGAFACFGLLLAVLSLLPPGFENEAATASGFILSLLHVVAFVAGSTLLVVGTTLVGASLLASPADLEA